MPRFRLGLPVLLLACLSGCAAPTSEDEVTSGTQDITATQTFSDVCASSSNTSRRGGAPTGDAGSVLYLARCAATGPGRIVRVDFKANTAVEIATFDAKATTVWFEDVGNDFALWSTSKEKPGPYVPTIERTLGLWDASLPQPVSADPRTLFPQGYDDGRTAWVDFVAYAGKGRVVASWQFQYRSRKLGVVSLPTGAALWTSPQALGSERTDLRFTPDRRRFLVSTTGGPYVIDVGATIGARALDQALLGDTMPWTANGEYPALDGKRVLLQASRAGRLTWSSVDLGTGVRTDLGEGLAFAGPLGAPRGAVVASDGTPAALVRGATPSSKELRVVRADGSIAAAAVPDATQRIRFVAKTGAFAVVEEIVQVPQGNQRVELAKLWMVRPGASTPAAPLFGGALVGPASTRGDLQELTGGVNLFVYTPDRKVHLLGLDGQGAETRTFEMAARTIIPLQGARALVDQCVVDLGGAAPAPMAGGCIEGDARPNAWPWVAPSGARVFALVDKTVRVFRY